MSSTKLLYRTPRHVSLRSQQRRLRHVRCLAIRSLKSSEPILWSPLSVRIKFTLHNFESNKPVIYTSNTLEETYNPTWGSLFFSYEAVGENLTLSKFFLKVWLINMTSSDQEEILCFEKLVDLSQCSFIGMTIGKKDNLTYPINSIIIGTSDGYYSTEGGASLPSQQRPMSELYHYLPRNSLIEVRKNEVSDSYQLEDLKKLLGQQQRLKMLRKNIAKEKQGIITNRLQHMEALVKQEESIRLQVRVEVLKQQIAEQKAQLNKDSQRLDALKERLNQRESSLCESKRKFEKKQVNHQDDSLLFSQRKDLLNKTQRKLYLRQRTLISELSQTFCIKQMNETFTICDVILPHGDPTESGGTASTDQIGVALGFVSHLVQLMAQFLLIPLQYPIQSIGSKSTIVDNIHVGLDIREFPLYVKGTDKSLYQFGLYLLWRDILQVRQHCGYTTSKNSAKRTLPNLKSLLDKLLMDKYSIFPLRDTLSSSVSVKVEPSNSTANTPYLTDNFSRHLPLEENDTGSRDEGGATTPHSQDSFTDTLPDQEEWSQKLDYSPRSRLSALIDISRSPVLDSSPRLKSPDSPQTSVSYQNLSESPFRKTAYMLNVPRPFSNTDLSFPSLSSMGGVPIPMSCPTTSMASETSSQPVVYSTSDIQQKKTLTSIAGCVNSDTQNGIEKTSDDL